MAVRPPPFPLYNLLGRVTEPSRPAFDPAQTARDSALVSGLCCPAFLLRYSLVCTSCTGDPALFSRDLRDLPARREWCIVEKDHRRLRLQCGYPSTLCKY